LAVASRVSPLQGIITAIVAGFTGAFFGGSNFNIIGPTGALSGIIASSVLTQGIESVSMLAIITGIMVLIAYVLHFERYLIFIPSSVIHGFTLGVACIIGLNQLNFALGLRNLPVHPEFIDNIWESIIHISQFSLAPLCIFIIFLSALFLLKKFFRALPGSIIVSPFGIIFGYVMAHRLNLETLGSRYGKIGIEGFKGFQFPSAIISEQLIMSALVVALVAILETMLSAKIADNLTKTKHESNKELLGLGLANLVSGFAGGIPATAALARTVFNIRSGANDKMSAMLSAIFMVLISLLCLTFFECMPMAVIAAILVNVAVNMVEREHLIRLFTYNKFNFVISLLVALATLLRDPVIGILGGAMISLLFFVEELSHGYYELMVKNIHASKGPVSSKQLTHSTRDAGVLIYAFKGKLSYLNSQAHVERFESDLQNYKHIILNFREVYFMDIDGVDALDEIIGMIQKRNQQVYIANLNPLIASLLKSVSEPFRHLESKNLVFASMSDAFNYLGIEEE
jgi:SulP family sulfate permease